MIAWRHSRSGLSLLETIVGVGLLALMATTLLEFSGREAKALGFSQDRFLARLALEELEACFGSRPFNWYVANATGGAFEGGFELDAARIDGHPQVTGSSASATQFSVAAPALTARLATLEIRRSVTFVPLVSGPGDTLAYVRFAVKYKSNTGDDRELSTFRIVH